MDVKVTDIADTPTGFIDDVIEGLSKKPKTLPCKYFYDETGSKLFEDICDVQEYYITRTEIKLLEKIKFELSDMIGKKAVIIEPGAGAGRKIQNLLETLDSPSTYVPIDISADFLFYSAEKIKHKFPDVNIMPIQGDFTESIRWQGNQEQRNRVVFFPGSTIGNFTPQQAESFLKNQVKLVGSQGALLIGVDLVKSNERLEAAYNDKQGVTAQFNKNLLTRINTELGGNFDLQQFSHHAFFNEEKSRIEMHLKSDKQQSIKINQQIFKFEEGENIHTENSYKYSINSFIQLAKKAGLKSQKYWVDESNLFSIHFLTP
ncbi:L-histidine N(alpha)-methyltransferase [Aliikangiella sp. IMCC44359]|uniref:L-histidine N(alpha)-methyltransferase n=1 Tax=Aliikangiella sp. IMCC44359 TaxID=3459125 RepID=UPI00403B0360